MAFQGGEALGIGISDAEIARVGDGAVQGEGDARIGVVQFEGADDLQQVVADHFLHAFVAAILDVGVVDVGDAQARMDAQ